MNKFDRQLAEEAILKALYSELRSTEDAHTNNETDIDQQINEF